MKETHPGSEEKQQAIIENIEDGYFEVDLAGNYTFVNDVICRHLQYSREELIGKNNREYQDEANAKRTYKAFQEVYRTGEPLKAWDMEVIRKTGVRQVSEISISLIRDSKGRPIGFRGTSRDVTERRQMEEKLRQSEERYRTIIEQMEDGYFEVDLAGRFTFVNDAQCRNLGYSREELIGMSNRQYADAKIAQELYLLFNKIYKTGKPVQAHDLELIKKDGTKSFNEISASLIRNAAGKPIGFRGIARNVTARKQMEEALRQSEERYRTVMEEMEEWYFEADLTGNILFFNDAFPRALGRSSEALTGLNFRALLKENETEPAYEIFLQVYKTGNPIKNSLFELVRPDSRLIVAEVSIFPKRDQTGRILGVRGVGHDITERKQAEKQIQYLATHDALTDLPNRLMFNQLLNHAIQSARRFKRQFAVFFIDLDRFKNINDTLGHEAGDHLLQEIAARLKQVLREIDLVARLGGDEFVVLIQEVQDPSQVSLVAEKILSAIIKPITLMGQEYRITASVGICLCPKDGQDEQSLMKNADIAMYLAKEEGKNNYQFYSGTIKSQSIERLTLETNLRRALERNEFYLHYQAKLDFKTGTITGVEALLRWQNPDLGAISPTKLIPIAEETGLIVPIGRWILKTACAQNVSWQSQGLPTVCLAINLTLRQLMDDNLLNDITAALKDSGMAPNLLELEITEGVLLQNPERVIGILTAIKNKGVRLAIDDFGTGYSSLTQIRRYPIDTIKVDRSFIHDLPVHVEDTAITKAIIAMGKTLSLTVVAEGVETPEQHAFLREQACDEMQGYYFSKPTSPEEFADLLGRHVPPTQK